ncbi:MAG: outer membrane lipoprotein carrier protein LolA [Prevotella sp.]|nr:outer membrane lipoprotein carrier protein LolA [Prevotella sp.]MBP3842546.1 outer membrane lipoprotein carrier protein LolA [Prevotella sp.]
MKRLFLFLAFTLGLSTTGLAQNADFQKAVLKYKSASSATATVTRSKHNTAMTKDVVSQGTLTLKKPNYVCIDVVANDKKKVSHDQLIMEGSKFTMVTKGKKHLASSQASSQFRTFQAVFESILAGGGTDFSKYPDLTLTKQGSDIVISITPTPANKKEERRMMFTSFVLTIDSKTSALKSLRFNERKGNYTEYQFTDFKFK